MSDQMQPKVSVIIPMYNVEAYASRCLDSVLSQSYENVEVLIVDDGSTDSTSIICQDYAREHEQIRYLAKENGGLSSARNTGLRHCEGEFALFLDGDDRLGMGAIQTMIRSAIECNADLVVFGLENIDENEELPEAMNPVWETVSSEDQLRRLLLLDGETGSACGKLYHRSLFDRLSFPEGQLFEDFGVVASVIASAKSISFSDAALYGYVVREGSITRSEVYSERHVSGMAQSLEQVKEVIAGYPSLNKELKAYEVFCQLRLAGYLDPRRVHADLAGYFSTDSLRKDAVKIVTQPGISSLWRIRCLLFAASPALYKFAYSLLKK